MYFPACVSRGILEVEFWFFLSAVIVDFSPHIACLRDFLFYGPWFVGKFGERKVAALCFKLECSF
jgi:hypothetical protein